jgi:hypothetical protein
MTTPELLDVTGESRRKRHLALAEKARTYERSGNVRATTLCSEDCCDQVTMDRRTERYGMKPVVIADLPLCKKCEKAAGRLVQDVPEEAKAK